MAFLGRDEKSFFDLNRKTITQSGIDNSSTRLAEKYNVVMASAGQGLTREQTSMFLLSTYVNQSVIVIHAAREV